jgi:hypothetical protein
VSQKTILDTWQISADYLTELVNSNPSLRGMIVGYIAERKLKEQFEGHKRTDAHHKDDDHDRTKKGDLVVSYKGYDFRIEVKSLQTNQVEVLMPDGVWMKLVAKKAIGRKASPGTTKSGKPKLGAQIFKWVPDERYLALPEKFRKETRYRGAFQCDASDRRKLELADKEIVETTLLKVGEFDILAAGIFGFRGEWEFGFALNEDLPRSTHGNYSQKVRDQLIASLVPISLPLTSPFVSDPFTLLDILVERKEKSKGNS